MSWRRAFEIFAVLGVIWTLAFVRWFGDAPARHPSVNAAELVMLPTPEDSQRIGDSSGAYWAAVLRSRTVWALWVQYYCLSHGWYFYITWLPTYLLEARGVSLQESAVLSGLPLFFGGVGSFASSYLIALLQRLGWTAASARRWVAGAGCLIAGSTLAVSVHVASPLTAMLLMGFASFANDLAVPPGWATCMDVGGRFAGTLSGSMNAAGNVAGFVAPAFVAYLLAWTGQNWDLTFYVSAGIYFIGALCWTVIDPTDHAGSQAGDYRLADLVSGARKRAPV